ncbi:YMGG-like glycine zipper-containing protein [Nitrosomonas ureae]|nr:YMGG-like glycine zipper-containing protein [Nitrosomonas ureae]
MKRLFIFVILCLISACANLPKGPSIMALPGSGKSFEQFRSDDNECREYAFQQLEGNTPQHASNSSGVQSAVVGTGLGAAAGGAIGGGEGAAIGAGLGLLMGAIFGRSNASTSGNIHQQTFDNNYIPCMYAKGHSVPVAGNVTKNPSSTYNGANRTTPTSSPNINPPLPPSDNPPPPPSIR